MTCSISAILKYLSLALLPYSHISLDMPYCLTYSMQQAKKMNQSVVISRQEPILLWISKDYYLCKNIELLESPLGTNETISQVVNDIDAGYYKDCLALWYSVEDKRITLAFANRKEGGPNQ